MSWLLSVLCFLLALHGLRTFVNAIRWSALLWGRNDGFPLFPAFALLGGLVLMATAVWAYVSDRWSILLLGIVIAWGLVWLERAYLIAKAREDPSTSRAPPSSAALPEE